MRPLLAHSQPHCPSTDHEKAERFRRPKRIAIVGTPIIQREPQCPSTEKADSFNKEKYAIRNAY